MINENQKSDLDSAIVERLKHSLTHDFNQLICVASRNIAGIRRLQNAGDQLAIAPPNTYFVSGFDGMGRLSRSPID